MKTELPLGELKGERKGGILGCTCRSRVSEGLDFSDNSARTVIVVGTPCAPINDKGVRLKMERLRRENPCTDAATRWYEQDAMFAENQAIRRVIRHHHDYGAIYLLGCQFVEERMNNLLPK